MSRYIYTILFYLLIPVLLLRLGWRSWRRRNGYGKRWYQRFGFGYPKTSGKPYLWIHTVSVGEFLAAVPFIKSLQQNYPDYSIVITTMTVTGAERVKATFTDQIQHVYLPYDLPDAVARFLQHFQPKIAVLMETELWPNLIHACFARNIPLFLINARLSESSAKGYLRFPSLVKDMVNKLTLVAAQAKADAERFVRLGIAANRVKVLGNIKFDLQLPDGLFERARELRQQWGPERFVWIASSTHQGEEEIVLQAFQKIKSAISNALLVLVPRHPERFESVAELCRKQGHTVVLRSEQRPCHTETTVFVGDTMGELLLFYAAADLAFVGGSLIPIGGHNLLEPAAVALPSLTGPHMFNFVEVNRLLQEADAVFPIENAEQIAAKVIELFNEPDARKQAGLRGQEIVDANRGALKAHLEAFKELLPSL